MLTTEKDKSIIVFFIENDNEPTHATDISKKSGAISKKWAGDRCDHLEDRGMLIHKMSRPARQAHETKYYFLASTFKALHVIVDAFDHDRTAQTAFMRSHYYRAMSPDLVQQFKDSIPESDLCAFATHHHAPTREQPFIQADEYRLTDSLETNWFALKFVTHFISVSPDERTTIIHQLKESTSNPYISLSAARCDECKKCFCAGMDACQPLIGDDKKALWRKKRIKAEIDAVSYRINLREFFHQLDYFNSNYSYLFD